MKPTAATLILSFLTAVKAARLARIARYMAASPLDYPQTTTRNVLSALTRAGRITRVSRGWYAR